jgi:molybdopterin converting factor small subunit
METETKKQKYYKKLDRVSIHPDLTSKLETLTQQANESLLGVSTISKSDVVNLILKRREGTLSQTELDELKSQHFDVVKYLAWLQSQAKTAKENGETMSLKELFERSSQVIQGVKKNSVRRIRKKKNEPYSSDSTPLKDIAS